MSHEDRSDDLGSKASTRASLRAGVLRAVQLLEARCDDPPNSTEMARAAGLSLSHFHRVFKNVVGETVASHVTRLRIERAASILTYSSWLISDIALACGYQSQANFGRDFKKFYGLSPKEYRKQEGTIPFLRGYMRSRGTNNELADPIQPLPTVSIETWPTLHGLASRHYGSVRSVVSCWHELIGWAKKDLSQSELKASRFLGIWYDGWNGKDEQHYRYDAVIVPPEPRTRALPEPFSPLDIPGGEVAVTTVRGSLPVLDRAWFSFATGWMPYSGFQPRGHQPGIDEYEASLMLASVPRQLVAVATKLSLRLCIPVQTGPVQV